VIFVLALTTLSVVTLAAVALTKGFEKALPVAAFLYVLFPEESKIPVPGLFDLTTQRFMTITLILLCFFLGKRSEASPKKLPLKLGVIALVLWSALAAVNSVVMTISVKAVASQFLDYILIYFLFVRYISSTVTIRKILYGLVAGMTVCSIFGLLEIYGGWTVMSLFPVMLHRFDVASGNLYVDMARGVRAQSTFGHPILLGSAIAMTVPIALYLISTSKSTGRRLLLWTSVALLFTCIYKTGSRGPWLALAISLMMLLACGRTKLRKYLSVIAFLTIAVLIVRPGIWETIANRYLSTFDRDSSEGESYSYRFAVLQMCAREVGRSVPRMIWGYGPESFVHLNITGVFNGRILVYTSCDNSIALLLVETGYIGFLIAVLVLAAALRRTYRGYRKLPSPSNALSMVFFVSIAAFCFMMTNVAIWAWGQENILLWIVIAMAMTYPGLVNHERKSEETAEPAAADSLGEPVPAWGPAIILP
jgi:O-antigen ligase